MQAIMANFGIDYGLTFIAHMLVSAMSPLDSFWECGFDSDALVSDCKTL
jgi:hypothetical protein